MSRRDEVVSVIVEIAREMNETLDAKIDVGRGVDAPLYGRNGVLDSLGLVSLLAGTEQALADKFGVAVALADERAVSQQSSPFRSIGTLADYAASLIDEAS